MFKINKKLNVFKVNVRDCTITSMMSLGCPFFAKLFRTFLTELFLSVVYVNFTFVCWVMPRRGVFRAQSSI